MKLLQSAEVGLLVTLALGLVGCGNTTPEICTVPGQQNPIIQGEACAAEDYPSAVAILVDAEINMGFGGTQPIRTVVCTGTLIAPDVVLTAAHCLDPSAMTMGFGTVVSEQYYVTRATDLADLASQSTVVFPEDAVPASGWIRHPDFSLDNFQSVNGPGDYKDVGLVFLSETIDLVPAVVIDPSEDDQLLVGTDVAIVGWGQQTAEPMNPFSPPTPGSVGVKVCATSHINEIGDFEMQIGDTGSRKCHGDSGGPSYMDVVTDSTITRRVIGVTSHAYDLEDCAKGGVDTRVDTWRDWLSGEMTNACANGTRVWCDIEGIIAPSYYDPPVVVDPTPGDNPIAGGGACIPPAG